MLKGKLISGNVFAIGQKVSPPPPASLTNAGALALISLLTRIAPEKVAAFFAVADEPLLKFSGVFLLA